VFDERNIVQLAQALAAVELEVNRLLEQAHVAPNKI
jgi:hypothetical protein